MLASTQDDTLEPLLATEAQKVDDADDSGPDATTRASEAPSVSPVASSRPSAKRPMRHKQRKIEKTMEHVKRVKERLGLVFTEAVDRDTYVGQKREAYTKAVKSATMMGDVVILERAFAPLDHDNEEELMDSIAAVVKEEKAKFVTSAGGWSHCRLCSCPSNSAHLAGARHQNRAKVHAWDSLFLGSPKALRSRNATDGQRATRREFVVRSGARCKMLVDRRSQSGSLEDACRSSYRQGQDRRAR